MSIQCCYSVITKVSVKQTRHYGGHWVSVAFESRTWVRSERRTWVRSESCAWARIQQIVIKHRTIKGFVFQFVSITKSSCILCFECVKHKVSVNFQLFTFNCANHGVSSCSVLRSALSAEPSRVTCFGCANHRVISCLSQQCD